MSTPESESSNKYHREQLFPSTMLEIGSQRSASQVTDTETAHGRFLWHQPEGHVLDALLLPPGYSQPILEMLQVGEPHATYTQLDRAAGYKQTVIG